MTGCTLLCHPAGPCPDGHFYLEHSASCLPCFCFGVTNVCQSSRRFRDQIRLRFDQPDDFKGALMGGQLGRRRGGRGCGVALGGGNQVPVGSGRGQIRESSMRGVDGVRFKDGHRVAEERLSPVGTAFQGETNILGKTKSRLDVCLLGLQRGWALEPDSFFFF